MSSIHVHCLREVAVTVQFAHWLHSRAICAGMEVRVREAELSTNEGGLATDVFKLTTLKGAALPDTRAKEVVERVCCPRPAYYDCPRLHVLHRIR